MTLTERAPLLGARGDVERAWRVDDVGDDDDDDARAHGRVGVGVGAQRRAREGDRVHRVRGSIGEATVVSRVRRGVGAVRGDSVDVDDAIERWGGVCARGDGGGRTNDGRVGVGAGGRGASRERDAER